VIERLSMQFFFMS